MVLSVEFLFWCFSFFEGWGCGWGLALASVVGDGCLFIDHWLGIDGKERWFV